MGQFLSKRHQNHPHYHHHHHQQQHQHQQLHAPPPSQPPRQQQPPDSTPSLLPLHASYTSAANAPYPSLLPPRQPQAPPRQQQPPDSTPSLLPLPASYTSVANAPYPSLLPPVPQPQPQPQPFSPQTHTRYNYNYNYNYSYARPVGNMMCPQPSGNGYFPPPPPHFAGSGWGQMQPPALPLPPHVPYVDHQSAKKIKNDVNVHKDTIRLEVDEENRDCHLVSFVFDALVDGSITIFYFAKEGPRCMFSPVYPEMYVPAKISFQKGLSQRFRQPSGSGIDLGFFDIDDLSKPLNGDVFPLVISAESTSQVAFANGMVNEEAEDTASHAQITQAVIEKNNDDNFHVKVIKQILWIDEVRYELREIFGISNEDEVAINDKDSGKECVICMTEPKDTAVLPCRHMCMCSDCAKELRLQSNKCPICRQPIEELLEIRVHEGLS